MPPRHRLRNLPQSPEWASPVCAWGGGGGRRCQRPPFSCKGFWAPCPSPSGASVICLHPLPCLPLPTAQPPNICSPPGCRRACPPPHAGADTPQVSRHRCPAVPLSHCLPSACLAAALLCPPALPSLQAQKSHQAERNCDLTIPHPQFSSPRSLKTKVFHGPLGSRACPRRLGKGRVFISLTVTLPPSPYTNTNVRPNPECNSQTRRERLSKPDKG